MILEQLEQNTRVIISRFGFKHFFFPVFKLQRKKKFFWKTTAYVYPEIMADKTSEYVVKWLLSSETENEYRKRKYKNPYKTGVNIFNS